MTDNKHLVLDITGNKLPIYIKINKNGVSYLYKIYENGEYFEMYCVEKVKDNYVV